MWMGLALAQARLAEAEGDVPVGAVVVAHGPGSGPRGRLVGRGRNARERLEDPTAHAELSALRDAAGTLGRWRLGDCTLYATLEPCFMCAGALVNARLGRLVYAVADPKAGAVASLAGVCSDARLNHQVEVRALAAGPLADECGGLLRGFFRARRQAGGRQPG